MNTKKLMLQFCVVMGGLALGCDTSAPVSAAATTAPLARAQLDPQTVAIRAGHSHPVIVEWKTVDTFEQLLGASDLVVEGTVVGRRFVTERLYGYSREKGRRLTPEEAGNEFTELRLTESTVRIDRIARHSDRAATWKEGQTIVVSELGGRLDDGCIAVPDDKPLLETGDDVVLFLSAAGKPGVFHQVGGWQGRTYVEDGVVHPPESTVPPQTGPLMRFEGLSVDKLLAEAATRPGAPLPEWDPTAVKPE